MRVKPYGKTFRSISSSFLCRICYTSKCIANSKNRDWLRQIFIKFVLISIMKFFHYYKMYFTLKCLPAIYEIANGRSGSVWWIDSKMYLCVCVAGSIKVSPTRSTSIVWVAHSNTKHICAHIFDVFRITTQIISWHLVWRGGGCDGTALSLQLLNNVHSVVQCQTFRKLHFNFRKRY